MAQLGIIGGGVMAEAILARVLEQRLFEPTQVLISDVQANRLASLREQYGVLTTTVNSEVAQTAEVLLLAIKPQIFPQVAVDLRGLAPCSKTVISIMAGVSLTKLGPVFPQSALLRVMPNTPATVGAGITAIAANDRATEAQLQLGHQLFATVGQVLTVPEAWMDAVTGLSGSGPAFVAIAIEALTDGGVAAGLPRAVAAQLAVQTVRGTTELMLTKELHPALLKDQVTSPGGTTITGVAQLEAAGFRSALIQAVLAATQRSRELGA